MRQTSFILLQDGGKTADQLRHRAKQSRTETRLRSERAFEACRRKVGHPALRSAYFSTGELPTDHLPEKVRDALPLASRGSQITMLILCETDRFPHG